MFVETLSLVPEEIGHGHVIADVLWSCMDSLWSCLNMNLAIDDCKPKVSLRHPCIHSASSTQKLYCVEHRRLCGQFLLALASFPDSTPQLFITLCIKLARKFCHVKCVGCIDIGFVFAKVELRMTYTCTSSGAIPYCLYLPCGRGNTICLEFGSWTCLLNKCSMSERDQKIL